MRNVPRRLEILEDSLSDEGGGDAHTDPQASRPWIPYPRCPYPMPPPYPSSPLELPDHWHRRGREDPTHIWWSNSEFLDMRDLTDLMSFFWPDVVFRTMFCFTPEDPSSTTIATNKNNTKNCNQQKKQGVVHGGLPGPVFQGQSGVDEDPPPEVPSSLSSVP